MRGTSWRCWRRHLRAAAGPRAHARAGDVSDATHRRVSAGTFDPIHCGHLGTAFELWQELRLAEVRFLPTQRSVSVYAEYETPLCGRRLADQRLSR